MKKGDGFVVILVTAPEAKRARALAKGALQRRYAACANLVPRIESHYWWKGKLEQSSETLLVFKTTRARAAALEAFLLERHPYDTPEILALPILQGTARYLEWIRASV